jgi:hypothetical protein
MPMKQFLFRFSQIKLPFWSPLLVLLFVLVLAFGLLIPWLGYGYDEWHFVYYATRGSEGLLELFHYDGHPQAVWPYILGFDWLGYQPLAWHILSLAWRGLAVLVFWWVFHLTWPDKPVQNFSAALIFAIYPFFSLQILPVSYFEVWLSFSLLGLSFAFSLLAVRNRNRFILLTGLAVLFKIGHVFTSEYTWFLEVIRPALLWFAMPASSSFLEKARRTSLSWLPHLVLFIGSTIWRGFYYTPIRTTFQVQADVLGKPFEVIASWFLNVIPDAVLVLFTSWFAILSPEYFRLDNRAEIYLLAIALSSAAGLFVYLNHLLPQNESSPNRRWAFQAMLLGGLAVLFGVLPFYIGGYTISLSKPPINSRFALGFLPGAALFVAGMLEILVTSRRARHASLALLVGFSISWHVRYTNEARELWTVQSEFFRQLIWRAPGVQPGVVFHVVEPFIDFPSSPAQILVTGDFSYAMALNALYQVGPRDEKLSYWYHSDDFDVLSKDEPFVANHATTTFTSIPGRDLYFYFAPQEGTCLRVLQPTDAGYRHFPESVHAAAELASLAAIDPSRPANTALISAALNVEDGKDRWCYYYQKAELARQFADWGEVVSLWETADGRNLRPRHGMELLPFVEAYARKGDFENAIMISRRANQISRGMSSPICSLWRDIAGENPIFKQVRDAFDCAP